MIKRQEKVPPHIYKIYRKICKAIKERRLLYFYFESDSGNYCREIRPYMITLIGTLKVVGLPTEQLELNIDERQPRHYFLDKLDMKQFKIIDETFDDPGVKREIVVKTINPVACRFIYDDEDEKEVMKSWIEIVK